MRTPAYLNQDSISDHARYRINAGPHIHAEGIANGCRLSLEGHNFLFSRTAVQGPQRGKRCHCGEGTAGLITAFMARPVMLAGVCDGRRQVIFRRGQMGTCPDDRCRLYLSCAKSSERRSLYTNQMMAGFRPSVVNVEDDQTEVGYV